MASSARAFLKISFLDGVHRRHPPPSSPLTDSVPSPSLSRRVALLLLTAPFTPPSTLPSLARERRARKPVSVEDYTATSEGLKYYDIVEGKGPIAERGANVRVHFDCVYRGVTAVSSRESKLLAGNRSIAQPYEFKVGSPPGKERKRDLVDNANGLFSAQAAPKPPAVMYTIIEGMRVGGKRTVIVPPELGYGEKGMNEIPNLRLCLERWGATGAEGEGRRLRLKGEVPVGDGGFRLFFPLDRGSKRRQNSRKTLVSPPSDGVCCLTGGPPTPNRV